MNKKLNNWERLEAVIRWADMSTNYFARYIGLPRGENLYQIKRGRNGISLDVAEHVVAKFPEIDKLWLLTGEGQMFNESHRQQPVPYYWADVEQSIRKIGTMEADDCLYLPNDVPCDFAMRYTGRAMGAAILPGTIVGLQQVAPEEIFPGSEYVIVSKKIVTLRIVRAADDAQQWRLIPGDRENFDEILMNKSDIEAVYKVKVKLIIND